LYEKMGCYQKVVTLFLCRGDRHVRGAMLSSETGWLHQQKKGQKHITEGLARQGGTILSGKGLVSPINKKGRGAETNERTALHNG